MIGPSSDTNKMLRSRQPYQKLLTAKKTETLLFIPGCLRARQAPDKNFGLNQPFRVAYNLTCMPYRLKAEAEHH